MNKETDDFREQMLSQGVKPLTPSQKHHAPLTIKSRASARNSEYSDRRLAATHHADIHHNLDAGGEMDWLGPNDVLEYRKAGIQHRLYRSLRQGQLAIGSSLDLHGLTVEEARRAVWRFVNDCSAQSIRCGLLVHGKGWHGEVAGAEGHIPAGKARLKSHVNRWLREIPVVLAFCSAQAKDGGTGAVYVLIKQR